MATIRGTAGDDTVAPGGVSPGVTGGTPGAGADTIYGGDGWDLLDGGGGSDVADYGELAGAAIEIAFGAAAGDAVVRKGDGAALGTDTLLGGGWRWFIGTAEADAFSASGTGPLVAVAMVEMGAGDDTVDGGAARGVELRFDASPTGVLVDLADGTAADGWGGTDTLVNIGALRGSDHDDTLLGAEQDEIFRGGRGDDVYDGREGFDGLSYAALQGVFVELVGVGVGYVAKALGGAAAGLDVFLGVERVEGTAGDDTLIGTDEAGAGSTLLRGGAGDDRIEGLGNAANVADYGDAASGVRVDLTAGYALGVGTDTLVDVVAVAGSAGADTMAGSADGDALEGAGGADILTGGAGADSLSGGAGADFLFGQAGNDSIAGGSGADALVGEAGADTLDGGAGNDVLLGGAGSDLYLVDSGLDLVDEGNLPAYAAYGFGGADTVVSSANFWWDLYSVAETLAIAEGAADPGGAGTTAVGGVFDNTLVGNSGTNILFGRGGSDTYRAGDGVDFVSLSTLGVGNAPGYTANGMNTVVVDPRATGATSYDIVFEFEPGRDRLDVSAYGYGSAQEVLARGIASGGNCYFVLGDGLDYLYLVGVQLSQVHAADFVV